jgi:hypothetical protein
MGIIVDGAGALFSFTKHGTPLEGRPDIKIAETAPRGNEPKGGNCGSGNCTGFAAFLQPSSSSGNVCFASLRGILNTGTIPPPAVSKIGVTKPEFEAGYV